MKREVEELLIGDLIIEELIHHGVEKVFGVVSIHNLPIYDALTRRKEIEPIIARSEGGAVNMADGYAKSTGKLGVVFTSSGTGAGNAAGAIVESWDANTPLLHITGQIDSAFLDKGKGFIHESKDQLSMLESVSKDAFRVQEPEQIVSKLRKSIDLAYTVPSGPISVEIPINFQSAIVSKNEILRSSKTVNNYEDILSDELITLISDSNRPVIWAGGGVVKSGVTNELKILAEKIGAAVITSYSGRGSIPEKHSQCIGNFSAFEQVQKLITGSDLLLSIGVSFRGNETSNWKLELPDNHININGDFASVNKNFSASYEIVGDAKEVISLLNEKVDKEINKEYLKEILTIKKEVRQQVYGTLGIYKEFLNAMRKNLPNDAILVQDVTVPATSWGSRLFEINQPRTSVHAAGLGIGQGLPMAVGAQVGCSEQLVVAMIGDGGFMVNLGEIATVAQMNLPIIILVFDDNGYGILRNIQDKVYGKQIAVDLSSPDFVKLGESVGIDSTRVKSPEEFENNLKQAISQNKPKMIVIDMNSVGSMNEPYTGLPGATKVFEPKRFR